jgi:hypothetical protein
VTPPHPQSVTPPRPVPHHLPFPPPLRSQPKTLQHPPPLRRKSSPTAHCPLLPPLRLPAPPPPTTICVLLQYICRYRHPAADSPRSTFWCPGVLLRSVPGELVGILLSVYYYISVLILLSSPSCPRMFITIYLSLYYCPLLLALACPIIVT